MHTRGPWRIGKNYGSVVSDVPAYDPIKGADDVEAYGGYLIAESISPSNRPIIAAAPEMLEALKLARDAWDSKEDTKSQRKLRADAWKAMNAAIEKAGE